MNGSAESTEHARFDDGDPSSERPFLGAENALVQGLFSAVDLRRPEDWSPLLLYGDSGSGKSFVARHLSLLWSGLPDEGTSHSDSTNSSSTTTSKDLGPGCFTTAYDIVRLFMPSRLKSDLESSRVLYQSTPLLVIDDVEHLVDRELASGWLSTVLDARHAHGLPSIVTTKSMAALRQLPSALFSRLTFGLPVRCFLPSAATRREIIREAWCHDDLADSHLLTLVEQSEGLSVAATRTLAFARSSDDPKSMTTRASDNQSVPSSIASTDFPRVCLKAVARRFGVRVADIKGSSRRKNTVMARSVAMFLIREFTSLSLIETGRFFQNRDHTTVRHACNKVKKLLLSDAQVQEAVQSLCSTLQKNYNTQWTIHPEVRCA